jgi:hypothetical protein
MKIERTFLKPKLGTFFKHLTLQILLFWALGALIYIFTSPNPFELKLYSWWLNFILLPVGIAIGVTIGTRRFQLVITDTNDLEKTNEWSLEHLTKNGLIIKDENKGETTLKSNKVHNRLFNNWFGTELIYVNQINNKIIVSGPFRLIERLAYSVDSKLKFGEK